MAAQSGLDNRFTLRNVAWALRCFTVTNGQFASALAEAPKRNGVQHGDISRWFEYQKGYPSTLPGHCLSKRSIDSGDSVPRGAVLTEVRRSRLEGLSDRL